MNPRPKSGRSRKYTREYDEKIKALIHERPEDPGLHFNTWSVRKLSEYMCEQGFPIVHRRLKEAKINLKKETDGEQRSQILRKKMYRRIKSQTSKKR